MSKVVINTSHCGFNLSQKACTWLKNHGVEVDYRGDYIDEEAKAEPVKAYSGLMSDYVGILGNYDKPIERHNPILVRCIEELGEEASGRYSNLVVKELSGNLYRICEYDGYEYVETPETIIWTIAN